MKCNTKTLPNGLRVMTVPMKDSQSAIVMVLVEAGSHFETKNQNGIAHFLEHMCFKGTKTRTYHELNEQLDSLGAEYNAFTSFQHTGYYARAHYKKINTLIDIVSDMYINQTLPEEEIEKERGVILDEINMYLDMPARLAWYTLRESMYGNTPAGRTVLGTPDIIKKISKQDFIKFKERYYNAQNTVVVVAGNVETKDINKVVAKHFKDMPTGAPSELNDITVRKGPKVSIHKKKTDQTRLLIGFETYDTNNPKSWAAFVLANILGGSMSSRLPKKVREERGLCYSINAVSGFYINHGEFVIGLGTHHKKVLEALELIYEEINDLKTNLVSAAELKKAKEHILGNFAINLETSSDVADYYGFQEVHNEKVRSPREYTKMIREVTPEMIRKVAKEILTKEKAHLALVGPNADEKKLRKIINQ